MLECYYCRGDVSLFGGFHDKSLKGLQERDAHEVHEACA